MPKNGVAPVPLGLQSPLSGRVDAGFGGGSQRHKNKVIFGVALACIVPFLLSTFAASVTVGSGALEFGQGSQQAIACDPTVFAAISEEWHSLPVAGDTSAGFFRVRGVTISNLDLVACKGKKLRVRLINTAGAELAIGPTADIHVLQISLPNVDAPVSTSDAGALALTYLTGDGATVSSGMAAVVSLNVSGTSIYDGSDLSPTSADVTFYVDPTATLVNLDGQLIGRTTVETVNNPTR
ncbi:MAG: hypothetical protein F2845_06635 [Actinobacteria bacterium]|nr:hypothetical protein [Actinomycetota bacterium]MSV64449.1 hypothetical protein [Actinomycetota bacterium]MSW26327.1 hypothetical protein [Actinomycetota bacterium]MSW34644.1 hypothetical protein [Actinomycetota bacterium]MSX31670.1 hypothetical protein [Actinomycetota bacterium]